MKKFTNILICLLLCVMTFGFVSCGGNNNPNPNFPTASMTTYGNGGMAVQKGNYLYFVNGYKAVDGMTDKSETQNVHVGALMMAKLDDNGNLVTTDNGQVKDEYLTVMFDRLSGYEATGLYVFGDYLYFTSPCAENESGKNGEWAKKRVTFCRIKLDKSSKVEEFYTSAVENSNLQYNFYYNGTDTFLLVYEKGTSLITNKDEEAKSDRLVRIKIGTSTDEVLSDVTSVVMPSEQDDSIHKIFFTAKVTEGSTTKYVLYRYNLVDNTKTEFYKSSSTLEVTDVAGEYVHCNFTGETNKPFKRSKFNQIANFERVCYSDIYSKLIVAPDASMVVGLRDTNYFEFYIYNSSNPATEELNFQDTDATSVTIIGVVNGNLIYIDNNKNVKQLSISNVLETKKPEVRTIATLTDAETDNFDLDGQYLYFYQTVGSNKYLHRLLINNNINTEKELVGKYLEDDVPKVEESEEE